MFFSDGLTRLVEHWYIPCLHSMSPPLCDHCNIVSIAGPPAFSLQCRLLDLLRVGQEILVVTLPTALAPTAVKQGPEHENLEDL